MRVFLAGATGVIGRRLTPMLVEAGHEVAGMTRSDAKADALRATGVRPFVCDVYDAEALRAALVAATPEVVIHQLTDLPTAIRLGGRRKMAEQYAGNDRIRTEGTRNLVAAAVAAGARRIVAQSVAFSYAPSGGPVKTEDDPLFDDAPWPFSRGVEAIHDLEQMVTGTEGIEGIALRYGFFYGPGSALAADGYYAGEVRKRRFPLVGGGEGVFSFIHVDDAAQATVAALSRGRPGIYNVVDDDPAPVKDWLPYYADVLGAKKPRRVPKLIARLAAGRSAVLLMTEMRGASNARAKQELGFAPRYASWRQGFREVLG